MANLTDADKVLRNVTGKDIVTQLTAIKTAIENGGGGSGASTVSQLTDVLLSANIPDGDVLVRDNNLTGGKLWKNVTITVELTQAEYDQLVADDEVLPDVDYYITDAPSMQGTSADLSYDGTTKSVYTKIGEVESELDTKQDTLTVQSITPTRNTTNISSSGYAVSCLKYGRVVVLSLVFTTARAINSDDIVLSDLPIPQYDTIRIGLFDSTNAKPIRFKVNTSGELSLHYDSMASGLSAYGEIVYISAT